MELESDQVLVDGGVLPCSSQALPGCVWTSFFCPPRQSPLLRPPLLRFPVPPWGRRALTISSSASSSVLLGDPHWPRVLAHGSPQHHQLARSPSQVQPTASEELGPVWPRSRPGRSPLSGLPARPRILIARARWLPSRRTRSTRYPLQQQGSAGTCCTGGAGALTLGKDP